MEKETIEKKIKTFPTGPNRLPIASMKNDYIGRCPAFIGVLLTGYYYSPFPPLATTVQPVCCQCPYLSRIRNFFPSRIPDTTNNNPAIVEDKQITPVQI
jgi:hypothetical protein